MHNYYLLKVLPEVAAANWEGLYALLRTCFKDDVGNELSAAMLYSISTNKAILWELSCDEKGVLAYVVTSIHTDVVSCKAYVLIYAAVTIQNLSTRELGFALERLHSYSKKIGSDGLVAFTALDNSLGKMFSKLNPDSSQLTFNILP